MKHLLIIKQENKLYFIAKFVKVKVFWTFL
jgi:hypothetical protein